jgi:3-hydroxyisobutyrate dehydrogenase
MTPEGRDMKKIAFLGLGAMGARMATRLLGAGYDVTVWNRTAAAVDALVASGAQRAMTPREAAADADCVIAMVRDDEASRAVWCDGGSGALAGMHKGALAIDCSTVSVTWARELEAAARAHGVAFLEAPVSGSRPQAEAGQLVFLVGGAEMALEPAEAVLRAMGAAVHHVGAAGSGALAKLATNALLGVHVAALAEIIGLLTRQGADANRTLQAIASTSVWAPVDHYLAGSMLAGAFSPQFPVELIEKDFGYAVAAAGSAKAAPTLATVRQLFHDAIERGLGQENMTSVARLFAA